MHRRPGNPVESWKDGRIVWIPADEIIVADEANGSLHRGPSHLHCLTTRRKRAKHSLNERGKMTNWKDRTQPIKVGDMVGYSKQFLQSTGQFTGDVPLARGKVTVLLPLGGDTMLAEIDWDKPDLPPRVNAKNLSTIKQIQLGE